MSSSQSRKLRASLGESWGDASNLSSDEASIHTFSGSESDDDLVDDLQHAKEKSGTMSDNENEATPVPLKQRKLHSQDTLRQSTASQTARSQPRQRATAKTSIKNIVPRSPRVKNNTHRSILPTSALAEPSFIMPSINTPSQGPDAGSPLSKSEARQRRAGSKRLDLRSRTPNSEFHAMPTKSDARQKSNYSREANQNEDSPGPWHYFELLSLNILKPTLNYTFSVFGYAMNKWLKPILAAGLAILIIAYVVQRSTLYLQRSVQSALTPLCTLPGSSYIIPLCASIGSSDNQPDFEELVKVQNSFEDVVQASRNSGDLAKQIRDGANSVSDVRSRVKYSQLPSKSQLDVELHSFIETAREASSQLQKYNIKIGNVLDRLIITNEWTLRDLEGVKCQQGSVGVIANALSYMNPLSVVLAPTPGLDELIFDRYVNHLSEIKIQILKLIDIAQALIVLLNGLEERLGVIGDLAIHDDVVVSRDHDKLLASIWSRLGGNRVPKKQNERSFELLSKVLEYKGMALVHVTDTLLKLQGIAAALDGLSEEVTTPETLGYRADMPVHYHIEIISRSLDGFRDLRGERLGAERTEVRKALDRLAEANDKNSPKGLPDRKKDLPVISVS